jgi:hypothetical protein
MPVRSKPDALLAPQSLTSFSVQERVLLFCLASDTDWERAGVTHATAQHLLVRGLINRASTRARFKLTPLRRDVLAALLKPPVDEQDGRSYRDEASCHCIGARISACKVRQVCLPCRCKKAVEGRGLLHRADQRRSIAKTIASAYPNSA